MGGRYTSALSAYHDLLKTFPGVPQLWFECAMAEGRELNFDARTSPCNAPRKSARRTCLLVLIGQEYFRLRRFDRARETFQRAVAADGDSVHAQLSLAAWWERERRLAEAWECVEACLARHPQDPQALYYRAFLLHRQGRNDEAAAALRDLAGRTNGKIELNLKVSIYHLLGVVHGRAWANTRTRCALLGEAKTHARSATDTGVMLRDYDKWDGWRRELLAALTPDIIRRWREEAPKPPARLAFLGGHPRSGTTLMEQILGAHPDVRAFDEPEAFPNEVTQRPLPAAGAARPDAGRPG